VVAKIQLGEGDAGIVYTSDVTPAAAEKVVKLEIPEKYNVLATYPIATLKFAPQADLAKFTDFVLSTDGQAVLKSGFHAEVIRTMEGLGLCPLIPCCDKTRRRRSEIPPQALIILRRIHVKQQAHIVPRHISDRILGEYRAPADIARQQA
jgi:hypothetical protein